MNDEDDYQSREESPYFGASINDSRGIYGWVFIGLGVFFMLHIVSIIHHGMKCSLIIILFHVVLGFYFSNDFYWGIGLLMRWLVQKTRPSNQLRNEINDNSEGGVIHGFLHNEFLKQSKMYFSNYFLVSSENNLKAERPNIMIILTDDMGFSDLGCFGGEIDTPNLDQLAAEGLRFTEYNTARCWPTRATMLSGRYSDGLSSSQVIIPELLKASGYQTAMVGKWHLGMNPKKMVQYREDLMIFMEL